MLRFTRVTTTATIAVVAALSAALPAVGPAAAGASGPVEPPLSTAVPLPVADDVEDPDDTNDDPPRDETPSEPDGSTVGTDDITTTTTVVPVIGEPATGEVPETGETGGPRSSLVINGPGTVDADGISVVRHDPDGGQPGLVINGPASAAASGETASASSTSDDGLAPATASASSQASVAPAVPAAAPAARTTGTDPLAVELPATGLGRTAIGALIGAVLVLTGGLLLGLGRRPRRYPLTEDVFEARLAPMAANRARRAAVVESHDLAS